MLTMQQVAKELKEAGASDSIKNVKAAMRFIKGFGCEDCDSYAEAKEKILISMNSISEEMYESTSERQREIIHERYSWVRE